MKQFFKVPLQTLDKLHGNPQKCAHRLQGELKRSFWDLHSYTYIIKRRIPKLIENFPRKKKFVTSLHTCEKNQGSVRYVGHNMQV